MKILRRDREGWQRSGQARELIFRFARKVNFPAVF
jgi:hypothetical protein